MNDKKDRTMIALEASIQHWKENLRMAYDEVLVEDCMTMDYCALCKEFYDDYEEDTCAKCPLYLYSKPCYKKGSKWDKAFDSVEGNAGKDDITRAVKEMLDELVRVKKIYEKKESHK